MDTNKMRKEFEAAWRARYPVHPAAALKRSGIDPSDYCNTRTKDAWWAWQASRSTIEVKLPAQRRIRHMPMPDENGSYNEALENCRDAIEAQGLKVAP